MADDGRSPGTAPAGDSAALLGLDDAASGGRTGRWAVRIGAALVALALAGWLAASLFGGEARAVRYVTEPATRADLALDVTATGSVEPTNTVEVSSELSGTVREVFVDYNSRVKVGQPLAALKTDVLEAQGESLSARLAAAEAGVNEASATVVEAKALYERRRALADRRIVSNQDLEASRAAYLRAVASEATAKANVVAAAAELRVNQNNLAKACICSPIDGVVLSRTVEPGQTVASSLQAPVLFVLAEDLAKMEVLVAVDEADVGQVREGQRAVFTVDAYPGRSFEATIREVRYGSEVVQGVVTYKAVLTTDNSELLLRPGMTATADIRVRDVKDALTVPNAALRFTPPAAPDASAGGRSFLDTILPSRPNFRPASRAAPTGPDRQVWVLADGAPKAVDVRIGLSDGRRTEIIAGDLAAGAAVIVDSAVQTR